MRSPSTPMYLRARLWPESLEERLAPATFTVTTTDDGGAGSLREAITRANDRPGADVIAFAIDGTGVQTISPLSPLPAITDRVVIAGQTQPGFAGAPLIELNGIGAGTDADGIFVRSGGAGSVIRGLAINRFSDAGIQLLRTSCIVRGCFIGTDATGTTALGNGIGIDISDRHFVTGAACVIGGTTPAARNVISGNLGDGVHIEGSDSIGHLIQGNYIGTDVTGSADLGNGDAGVRLFFGPSGNLIGGTTSGAGNVISGNGGDGVVIESEFIPRAVVLSHDNTVQGNLIGTDASGTAALGNSGNGVALREFTRGNVVGGTTPGARNIISENVGSGVSIEGDTATLNKVKGNFIGMDVAGVAARGNGDSGVFIGDGADGNVVGGAVAGARNVISDNGQNGVHVTGVGTTGNRVLGNFIGTDAGGTLDRGNNAIGVSILHGASGNVVGGPGAARNVISGNGTAGVGISDVATSGNRVIGNFIGTDRTGTVALGNSNIGVGLGGGATGNVVGGIAPGERNVISGNTFHGVLVVDVATTGNRLLGNFIGTDKTGSTALGNGEDGVRLIDAVDNVVGGAAAGAGNVISGNGGSGVHLAGSAQDNRVVGNRIGVAAASIAPLGNDSFGVSVGIGAAGNRIGGTAPGQGNIIANSVSDGVSVASGTGNAVLGNRIFDNGGLGIDLADDGVTANDVDDGDTGPNGMLNFPVLDVARQTVAGLRIRGSINTEPGKTLRIEFFSSPIPDGTGHGEGRRFLGFVLVQTLTGNDATFNTLLAAPGAVPGQVITATATDQNGNTSEFSLARLVT